MLLLTIVLRAVGGSKNPRGSSIVVGIICPHPLPVGIELTDCQNRGGRAWLPRFQQPCVHTAVVASVPHTLKYNDDTGYAYDAKGMYVVPAQERT